MNIIIAALGCSLLAPSFTQATPDTPPAPIALELVEPDWTQIGSGNYSPWVVDEGGAKVWNPSKSFNNWLATIPDEDKAWPILVDLRYKHDALFSSAYFGFLPDVGEDFDEDGVDDWKELSNLFDQTDMNPIMDQLLEAMGKPRMGYPLLLETDPDSRRVFERYGLEDHIENNASLNPQMIECTLQSLGTTRQITQLAVSYLSYIVGKGEIETFAADYIIMYQGSLLTDETPYLISTLVSIASQRRLLSLLRWALFTHGDGFTETQLAEFDRVIADTSINQLAVVGEQLQFHGFVRRVFNLPNLMNYTEHEQLGPPISAPYEQLPLVVRKTMALYDIPLNAAHESSKMYGFDAPSTPDWSSQGKDINELDSPIEAIGRLLVGIMMPATDQAVNRLREHRADTQAMRLAIAAHRHKLRHGSFPTSIGDFDQDLINFAFVDPFVGGNMIYRLDPEIGPMIYARGYDGDDDQGRYTQYLLLGSKEVEGDLLYYPNPWTTQEIAEDED